MVTDAGLLDPCSKMYGMKKSPQAFTNVKTATTQIPGTIMGITIFSSEPMRELPSIQAASSSSRGTASMKLRAIHVANGNAVAVMKQTVQNFELIKLSVTK